MSPAPILQDASPIAAARAVAGDRRLAAVLTLAFLALAGFGAWHHECWRDEAQAWLIARDAPSLSAVLEQAHYEGSPPLWIFCLRPLTFLTHRPEAMQVLNWILAGTTIWLIVACAPFGWLPKTLLIADYFLLFEYGIVCRNYLPGILCLVIACILYPSARERPWRFVFALIGAALASVHSLIVAGAIAIAFWGPWAIRALVGGKPGRAAAGKGQLGPLLLLLLGTAWAVYSMAPRPDAIYSPAEGWKLGWDLGRLAKVAWAFVTAHFPWPRPPGFFWIPPWDTPFRSYDPDAALVLGGLLFGGSVLALRRHLGGLLLYLTGTLGVGAFLYLKYLGFSRHTGFFFVVFLLAAWIAAGSAPSRPAAAPLRSRGLGEVLLVLMLVLHAVTGIWALRVDRTEPFSCGKQAAAVIRSRHLESAFLVVGPDWAGAPLTAYLDRTAYYPNAARYGSFTNWDRRRIDNLDRLSFEEFFRRAAVEARGAPMVISLDRPFPPEFMRQHRIEPLAELHGSLTPFEDYYLFVVPGEPVSPAAPSTGPTGPRAPAP